MHIDAIDKFESGQRRELRTKRKKLLIVKENNSCIY